MIKPASSLAPSDVSLAGGSGLLGNAFASVLGHGFHQLPRAAIAGLDLGAVTSELERARPRVLINCVAHTNVEAAESHPAPAWLANEQVPGLLANACAQLGIVMVHISSTGCYGSAKPDAYTEDDALQPPTVHHRSKAAGELRVSAAGGRALIVRTGWLYGGDPAQPKNFVWKRLIEARDLPVMTSDATQSGCPTYAVDVATQTLELLEAGVAGTFNVVAHGAASRFDYVSAIVRFADLSCRVQPGPGFKRTAPVSSNEMAINKRMQDLGLDTMTHWRTSLRSYVQHLIGSRDWMNLPVA
jgi:dTDP-4-dehydrorhamnose reductase